MLYHRRRVSSNGLVRDRYKIEMIIRFWFLYILLGKMIAIVHRRSALLYHIYMRSTEYRSKKDLYLLRLETNSFYGTSFKWARLLGIDVCAIYRDQISLHIVLLFSDYW
jgi:hypothetical protein